jgi:hypothetical protein
MIRIALLVLLFFLGSASAQPVSEPEIEVPESGQALQGVVSISGSTGIPGFQSSELAFSYDMDPTSSWFILYEGQTPIERGEITDWDTTTITDGNYRLRLRVYLVGGEAVETLAEGLRVRNYSPVETATPEQLATVVVEATATQPAPTRAALLTPTPLPPNPALVTHQNLQASFVQGILITLAVFGIIGLYLALKRLFQRR